MDVTSYLLGKQAGGGGGTPTLQDKSITITENGTTSVTADAGYDGLGEVDITTNVSGGGGEYKAKIDTSISGDANGLATKITKISPDLDTSQVTDFRWFFRNCTNLTEIPQINTSNATSINYMFQYCSALTTIPVLNFSNVTNAESVYNGCPNFTDQTLDNILVSLAMTKISLSFYKKLSEQGFNSTNYPASRIQALPHYQDFVNAGWVIGY